MLRITIGGTYGPGTISLVYRDLTLFQGCAEQVGVQFEMGMIKWSPGRSIGVTTLTMPKETCGFDFN